MTHAEQVKIDQIVKGMSEEYQTRALMNFDTKMMFDELERRLDEFDEIAEKYERVRTRYSNRARNVTNLEKYVYEMQRI